MNKTREAAADPLQEHFDLVEQLARLIAGEDDERFVVVFHSLVNTMDGFMARPGAEGTDYARALLERSAAPHVSTRRAGRRGAVGPPTGVPAAPPADSIYSDPVFLQNARKVIEDRQRIVGGVETTDFPDCVAIGAPNAWCCTGTLVAPNVVVTAGHCEAGGCSARVFVGADVEGEGQVVEVEHAEAHRDYQPPADANDIAVLILAEDLPVEPREIATQAVLDDAATTRLVGFGNTDVFSSGGYGKRRVVDVPIASNDPKFGADPASEFVAGAPFLDRDSCNGDSGGPAYVEADGGWLLAGATSRATRSSLRPCGDGGIYTRVHAFREWVTSVRGGHWS